MTHAHSIRSDATRLDAIEPSIARGRSGFGSRSLNPAVTEPDDAETAQSAGGASSSIRANGSRRRNPGASTSAGNYAQGTPSGTVSGVSTSGVTSSGTKVSGLTDTESEDASSNFRSILSEFASSHSDGADGDESSQADAGASAKKQNGARSANTGTWNRGSASASSANTGSANTGSASAASANTGLASEDTRSEAVGSANANSTNTSSTNTPTQASSNAPVASALSTGLSGLPLGATLILNTSTTGVQSFNVRKAI